VLETPGKNRGGGSSNRVEELARANNVSIMIFSLPVQRTGREKPVDYVGLLKVQTPADVGLDSDPAFLAGGHKSAGRQARKRLGSHGVSESNCHPFCPWAITGRQTDNTNIANILMHGLNLLAKEWMFNRCSPPFAASQI
jgi:hypothetical protein